MQKRTDKDATLAYSPTEGHSIVIYTHKFKPQHFRDGVKIVREKFPEAQIKHGQKRLNIFLERPSTHEIVNVSFFDGAADDWQKSQHRQDTIKELQHMLDKDIDVKVFKVDHVVGIG
jgi:hypothetical protein